MQRGIRGLLETVLYAEDLASMERFYGGVLGLPVCSDISTLGVGFRVGPGSVLLVFDACESAKAGRVVPSHGASGAGHVALRIDDADYDAWLGLLGEKGIAIEQEQAWEDRGERSIYVRDPAGNSVELITGDIWR